MDTQGKYSVTNMQSKKSKKALKIVLKIFGIIIGLIVVAVVGFLIFSAITAFKPDDKTPLEFTATDKLLNKDKLISFVTYNTGYAGLNAETDFFLDGGKGVNPESKEQVETNLAGINRFLELLPADFYFLQEVDKDSSRTFGIDQTAYYLPELTTRIYAQNHLSKWVPYPIPMIGSVDSGILTLTNFKVSSSERVSLPNDTSWPKSLFYFQRCFQVSRVPIENSDKELVMINTHLEAYSDDTTRVKQLSAIFSLMMKEYAAGNYVVVGGDFNTSFPNTQHEYPIAKDLWTPSKFMTNDLPQGFSFAFDSTSPTCRLLNQPYDSDTAQFYCIDGFIVSDNIAVERTMTIHFNFINTDHNPVMMYLRLIDDEEVTEE